MRKIFPPITRDFADCNCLIYIKLCGFYEKKLKNIKFTSSYRMLNQPRTEIFIILYDYIKILRGMQVLKKFLIFY